MPYVVERRRGYTAFYRDSKGRRKSAGVYRSRAEALQAAERAEAGIPVPARATRRTTLAEHVRLWLSEEAMVDLMPTTVRGYEKALTTYVLPALGDIPVDRLERADVEALLRQLRLAGHPAWVLSQSKAALGRSLRPLVPTVLPVNPAHGISIKAAPPKDFNLLTPAEVEAILSNLDDNPRAFATFLIATGCRFGEAAEVRVSDVNFRAGEVRISRRMVLAPPGSRTRFVVEDGTKAGTHRARTLVLPEVYLDQLRSWIAEHSLKDNDLLFPNRIINTGIIPNRYPGFLRQGEFEVNGRRFLHGTAYGYSGGGCRCDGCKEGLRLYRAGLAESRRGRLPRSVNSTGHLANDAWQRMWKKAVEDAGLDWTPRTHDLRHAYATNLLAAGVSIYEVKTLMGHQVMDTTLKYLHRVESQQSKARNTIAEFLPRG